MAHNNKRWYYLVSIFSKYPGRLHSVSSRSDLTYSTSTSATLLLSSEVCVTRDSDARRAKCHAVQGSDRTQVRHDSNPDAVERVFCTRSTRNWSRYIGIVPSNTARSGSNETREYSGNGGQKSLSVFIGTINYCTLPA